MSKYDYDVSRRISAEDPPFYALLMCCMRKADNTNKAKLRRAWPEIWQELEARYWAPDGVLETERENTQ